MVTNMHGYVPRLAGEKVARALGRSPAVALLGPRQCGKSTLARRLLEGRPAVYLDLQDRADRNKLNEPELFFELHREELVCLDEIQRAPELFPALRAEIDRRRANGRFLILGSASRDLLRQTTETLAGRIAFVELTPFLVPEVRGVADPRELWLRGGFPPSLLAVDGGASFDWRVDFVRTFLERDVPSFGFTIPAPTMERLWRLLAHYNGQTVNFSKVAEAGGMSVPTLKRHLALLEQTYVIRLLPAFAANLKKRLVSAPKVYLRDTGILHALLDIETHDDLLGSPACGASWEGHAVETVAAALPRHRASYLRTSNGAEVDLVMERGADRQLFEMKLSKAPKPTRGFHELGALLSPTRSWLLAPVDEPYDFDSKVRVASPDAFWKELRG